MDINGLLYSQIGYELKDPMRAQVRSTQEGYGRSKIPQDRCGLYPMGGRLECSITQES